MTMQGLLELYLQRRILRAATERTYRYCVSSVVREFGSDPCLEALTEEWWVRYRLAQLAGARGVTFNSKRRHLLALLDFAVARGLTPDNALRKVDRAPAETAPKKLVSEETLRAALTLLQTAREGASTESSMSPRWFWIAVVTTLYYTGMRRRQLVELRWADVDIAAGVITLRAESSKTRREWSIPIAKPLEPHLRFLARRTEEVAGGLDPAAQVFQLPLFVEDGRCFGSGRMTADYLSGWFCDLQKCLPEDKRGISAHRFRHTIATRLVRSTRDIKAVQTLLGHTSIHTTYGYVTVEIDDLRHALSGLANIEGGVNLVPALEQPA